MDKNLKRMLDAARESGMTLQVDGYTFLPPEKTQTRQVMRRVMGEPNVKPKKNVEVHSFKDLKKVLKEQFGSVNAAEQAIGTDFNFLYQKKTKVVSNQKAMKIAEMAGIQLDPKLVSTYGRWADKTEDTEDEELDSRM